MAAKKVDLPAFGSPAKTEKFWRLPMLCPCTVQITSSAGGVYSGLNRRCSSMAATSILFWCSNYLVTISPFPVWAAAAFLYSSSHFSNIDKAIL